MNFLLISKYAIYGDSSDLIINLDKIVTVRVMYANHVPYICFETETKDIQIAFNNITTRDSYFNLICKSNNIIKMPRCNELDMGSSNGC
jgi:hypothetical protein